MPLYEYRCAGCGEVFEVIQKFSDEPLAVHQECGAPVHRLLSAPAFQFKGSGWYVTDYAKAGVSGPPNSDGPPKNSSENSSKTETKSGESNSGESKSGESKSGESNSSKSKTAAASDKSKSG